MRSVVVLRQNPPLHSPLSINSSKLSFRFIDLKRYYRKISTTTANIRYDLTYCLKRHITATETWIQRKQLKAIQYRTEYITPCYFHAITNKLLLPVLIFSINMNIY